MDEIISDGEKPKRKRNPSPTHLTLKYLKARNIPARVVEKWVKTPQGGFRKDIFGADLQALTKECIIGIQAGAAAHHASKVEYAMKNPEVRLWISCESRKFHVWTWSARVAFNKTGARRKKPKWTPRVTEIYKDGTTIKSRPFLLAET